MSLLFWVNLALVLVVALGATLAGLAWRALLERGGALAARDYTDKELAPLPREQMRSRFLPQAVPLYAAR